MSGFLKKLCWAMLALSVISMVIACQPPATPTSPAATTAPAVTPTTTPTTIPVVIAKPTTPTTPTSVTKPTTATQKPEGVLNFGVASFSTEIYYVTEGPNSISAVEGVYERLVGTDQKLNLIPQLAEKWEMSPDAKVWTYYLRRGVKFHDNWGEMTAADVKFSLDEGTKTGSTNNIAQTWSRNLSNFQIVDDYTIRFNFKTAYVPHSSEASPIPGTFVVVSQQYVKAVGADRAGRKPVGTGPFQFVESVTGVKNTLIAVENHWRQTPYFKNLVFNMIPDSATVNAMLKTRQLDIAQVASESITDLKAAGIRMNIAADAGSLYLWLGGQYPTHKNFAGYNAKQPWVEDPKDPSSKQNSLLVRQALNLAIDRQTIQKNLIGETGSICVFPLYSAGMPWSDPKWQPIPYDLAKAKQLLAQAGYPNGITFDFVVYPSNSGGNDAPVIGQAIAMQWAQAGIKANIKQGDWAIQRPLMAARNVNNTIGTHGVPRNSAEPYVIYSTYFNTTGAVYYGIEDARVDDIQNKIVTEPDFNKRQLLAQQYAQLFIDNYWIIPLFNRHQLWAMGPRIAEWPPMPAFPQPRNLEYAKPAK